MRSKIISLIGILMVSGLVVLAWQIHSFSTITSLINADAAIILGAAVWDDQPSPVFEERIKHGIHLYEAGIVEYLIFTGGIGEGDSLAESEVARVYALDKGVPLERIIIETNSRITFENLYQACQLMKTADLHEALIVSDPLHMKRAIKIAQDIGIEAFPSPTPTTRYRTWKSKSGSLMYEVFFYIVHIVQRVTGFVEMCPN